MAAKLGDPEKSVNVQAMHLRKAKLLSSAGRGLHSAEMTPSDASNLLLSCLHAGMAKDSAHVVAGLRNAPFLGTRTYGGEGKSHIPPVSMFSELAEKHTLGEALDALFGGLPLQLREKYHFSCVFSFITAPRYWEALLTVDEQMGPEYLAERRDTGLVYVMRYLAPRPKLETWLASREPKEDRDAARASIMARGLKTIAATVPHEVLETVTGCIRNDRTYMHDARLGYPNA